ncbi:hypothetical protein ACWT_2142 [Actinoplanes sp. SE50]|uniref:DUF3488 and transglutaminase-like domain-containing protein n=1 Tax=unclassified Actinoplanes TaxID=2626549 RepID=UPI00023ECAC9|nr:MULTISPECIES: transglutaminase domain-containing protein [unclassified Actinoplanes]AEV83164.1 yebA-like uncharacterized protein [Actinoplanes sp. SE50/110]ATO81557.1 hypothetical protein ACWT_2142 [Actinoplanes sp. SE50]SLL98965.1 hypothetical protein ACSP50_2193 [Actinoplanes sp. SE50/110]
MVRWPRLVVVPLALAGMLALAGLTLGRIYADDLLFRLVAGAAIGSIGAGVATRRLPSWSAAPVSAVLLATYTALALKLAAGHAGLTTPFPSIVRDALVNGIPRLLTALIPVESTPDTVVVPVVATWLAGMAAVEVGVRARRVLLGTLTPMCLYAGALYVVGPNAGPAVAPTLGVVALVVAALAVSVDRDPAAADLPAAVRARSLGAAAVGLVAVVGLAAVVGPWISGQVGGDPVDPRRYVEPPQVDSLDESPLNRISGWMLAPGQQLFTYQPASPPAGRATTVRVRLAVLSDYDGVTWKVGALYRNAGRVLPESTRPPGTDVTELRQRITIAGLTGRLLPAVATPAELSGARVAFDAGTGTMIRPEGLTSGLTYTATSEVPTPDLNLLPTAEAPAGDAVVRYLTVGDGVPDPIQKLAEHLADGNGGAFDRASAIEQFLAGHYRETPDAPSGHAYPNLAYFLFGPRGRGGQEGTSEQFAASFALLARLTGLPSRVVVGFDAPAKGGQVTGGDAIAWPEVLFDGLGWVPFDPMPTSDDPRPVEEDFTPKPTTPPTTPPQTDTSTGSAPPSTPAAAAAVRPGGGLSGPVVAGAASGSVLLVLMAAGLTVMRLRRGLRLRRLGKGSPDQRITGAWREFTDALRLAGQPVPGHLSATEMAAYAAAPPAARRTALLRRATPVAPSRPSSMSAAPASSASRSPSASPVGPSLSSASTSASSVAASTSAWSVAASTSASSASASSASASATAAGSSSPSSVPSPAQAAESVEVGDAGAQPPLPPLPPLDALVDAVNTVGFAPGAAAAGQADRAGAQVLAYAAALRERQSWWRKIWWTVHPGPLRWHR